MSGGLVGVGAAQVAPIDIGTDLLAADSSRRQALDRGAVLWGHAATQQPLLHILVTRQPESLSSLDGAAKE